jgi:hypothetical protein
MNRRAISEFLVQNTVPGDLLKFRDEAEAGCVAIAANGMKFRFTNAQLVAAEPKMPGYKPKPTPKPESKPTTKRRTTKKD